MAMFKVRNSGSSPSLGNVYAEVNDIILTTEQTKVTLGWQPDEVVLWCQASYDFDSSTDAVSVLISMSNLKKTNNIRSILLNNGSGGSSHYTIPNTNAGYINSIDADGFTIGQYGAGRIYCRYIAYKFK